MAGGGDALMKAGWRARVRQDRAPPGASGARGTFPRVCGRARPVLPMP